MILTVRIAGSPARQFYADPGALPLLVAAEARHQLLRSVGTLQAGAAGEAAHVPIVLANRDGQCAALLADPPLGASAVVSGDGVELFAGVVQSVDLEAQACTIEVRA